MAAVLLRVLALVVLAVTAGCVSTDAGQAPTVEETDTQGPTQTDAPTLTTMEYPYGTQFVSVERVDASVAPPLSDAESVRFENLTRTRRETFLRALDADGGLTFRPSDERSNPFGFGESDRPEYVRYEGTWYLVAVGIV